MTASKFFKCVDVDFDSVQVRSGKISSTTLTHEDAQASIQKREIYIGNGKYRVKGKELETIHLAAKRPQSLTITTTDDRVFELQHAKDNRQWEAFYSKLKALYDKYRREEQFGSFLTNSSKQGLQQRKHQRNVNSPRRAFGKRGKRFKALSTITAWESNWPSDNEGDSQENGKVGQSLKAPTTSTSSSSSSKLTTDETKDETARISTISPVTDTKPKVPHDENTNSNEPAIRDGGENGEAGGDETFDFEMEEDDDDEVPLKPISTNKQRRTKKIVSGMKTGQHKRISKIRTPGQRRNEQEEDSDDDDIFTDSAPDHFTTPAAQRVVSPNGGTTIAKGKQSETTHSDTTTMDDAPLSPTTETTKTALLCSTPPRKQQQHTLSDFFATKKETNKNAKNSTTPKERSSSFVLSPKPSFIGSPLPRTFGSPASARMVRSAKKELKQSNSWLSASPTKSSLLHKRNMELFGNTAGSASTGKQKEPLLTDLRPDDASSATKTASTSIRPRQIKRPRLTPKQHSTVNQSRSTVRTNLSHSLAEHAVSPSSSSALASRAITATKTNRPQEDRSHQPYPCRGLRNLGNTCYLNASVQMLCTVPDFFSSLGDQKGQNLTRCLRKVSQELLNEQQTDEGTSSLSTTNRGPVNPRCLKEAIDEKTDKFAGFEQRDAHEFLSDLVDYTHEELTEMKERAVATAATDVDKQALEQTRLPTDDFRLTVQVCLKCKSCGYTRSKEEFYRHLSIDIIDNQSSPDATNDDKGWKPSSASIEKSLTQFFQPEIREVKCEKCKEGTHASQTLRILSSPKNLLLHLKRFIVVEKPREAPQRDTDENSSPNSPSAKAPPEPIEYIFKKNKRLVTISEHLSLNSFMVEEQQEARATNPGDSPDYALKSIVHHHGSRASSGHYTADAIRLLPQQTIDNEEDDKTINGDELSAQWITFDDNASGKTSLEKIASSKVKQATAYMLLYTKDK